MEIYLPGLFGDIEHSKVTPITHTTYLNKRHSKCVARSAVFQ
jgi:hypothetical protein